MSRIIPTKDAAGNPNGCLHLLWNALEEPDYRPEQVYLTVIAPGCCKGPHLHYKRRGWFHLIKGKVIIAIRGTKLGASTVEFEVLMPGLNPILVPAGMPACIYNVGRDEAWVINMPSPAYDPNDPDEHVPETWEHPDWWLKIQEAR